MLLTTVGLCRAHAQALSGSDHDLVLSSAVAKELKFSDAQQKASARAVETGNRLRDEALKKRADEVANGEAPSGPVAYDPAPFYKEIDETVAKTFTKGQKARLAQLVVQKKGLAALLRPDITTKMNLDSGQWELINQIVKEEKEIEEQITLDMVRKLREGNEARLAFNRGETPAMALPAKKKNKGDVPAIPEDLTAILKQTEAARQKVKIEARRRVMKMFIKKQRETYERLTGEPFRFENEATRVLELSARPKR